MVEGWCDNEYFILFDESLEADEMTVRYGAASFLPGYRILGLKGWDDFILRDLSGARFLVPTVPFNVEHLKPFNLLIESVKLRPDLDIAGKIKWYVHPLVLGGDPISASNMAWVTLEQHVELVNWWNIKIRELAGTAN